MSMLSYHSTEKPMKKVVVVRKLLRTPSVFRSIAFLADFSLVGLQDLCDRALMVVTDAKTVTRAHISHLNIKITSTSKGNVSKYVHLCWKNVGLCVLCSQHSKQNRSKLENRTL